MIGKTLSHYNILEKLGEGGMGVVYKAEDTKLKRTVALKFLTPQVVGTEEDKARFIHEAQAAAALNHNNICTVYEIDEFEGQPFIAMECVEGKSIKDLIRPGSLNLGKALDISIQVGEGLSEAHEKGIVHRDIKSANVMVTERGQAKIMDFGLAMSPGRIQLTRAGTTIGTVAYMSPEQARGEKVDHRADIWSLGIVLFEMISGQLPFRGDHEQAVLYSIMNEDSKPIADLCLGAPAELENIFRKCLAKDPRERYQTATDFVADLRRLKRTSVPRGTHADKPLQESRSVPWWPWVAAAAVVVIGAIVIWPRLFSPPEPQQSPARKMLVVLPFENLGPPEDEYFADGITEELTARLARIEGLGVIARTSAIQYKNTEKTIHQIGDELNVEYVLEGTIRWEHVSDSQSRIRVTPQLIKVSDATHLWADIYQRDMTGIFEVQADIAEQVAAALNIKLLNDTRQAIEAKPTGNLEAYNAYLRGFDVIKGVEYTREAWDFSIQMFERAVQLDPEFASAYAYMSLAHSGLYMLGYDRTARRAASSKTAVDRALELEPDNAEARMALAYYYNWCLGDYDLALEQFAIAEQGLPNNPNVIRGVAYIVRRKGQYEEAVARFKTAFKFSPQDADMAMNIGETLTPMRRYEEAKEYFELSIALAPDQTASYNYLCWVYWLWKGDTGKTREILERIVVPDENHSYLLSTQCILERNYVSALEHLQAVPNDKIFSGPWWFNPRALVAGLTYRLAGETDKAKEAFEAARVQLEAAITDQPEDPRVHSALGIAYAGLGRKKDAIREGKLATELMPVTKNAFIGPRRTEDLALIYTLVGEYEAALDEIEFILSIPYYFSVSVLRLDPNWDPLRDHPRYQKLMEGAP